MQPSMVVSNVFIVLLYSVMWLRKVINISIILSIFFFDFGECFWLSNQPNNINHTNALKSIDMDVFEEARKKKKKDGYLKALLVGAILVKMILFPLAVKAMAVMSTISVLLSAMSLIMSSIVGYAKIAARKSEPSVKVVHVNDIWSKGDGLPQEYTIPDSLEYSPNPPLEQIHYTI